MTPEQKQFAYKIAAILNDLHSLALHESYVRRYPKEYLEEQLRKTLAKPEHEIYTSRARYYNSMVQKNGSEYNRY
jgi:hypothetical protein